MKSYYRVMLGEGSVHAAECFVGGFIGTDFEIYLDLSGKLPEEWRDFNKEFIPIRLRARPGTSRVSAGLACGALYTVSKGIRDGDRVLSPDGNGNYRVGEVTGPYYYAQGQILFHRRPVHWLDTAIRRADMSNALKGGAGSGGTVRNISGYREEIEQLLGEPLTGGTMLSADGELVVDPTAFAMEKHLEDFLVANWSQTELGKEFNIYAGDGELAGQQLMTDTGPLDILAVSKDGKTLLVVELKKGRASDAVVGQILRYMGYVQEMLADPGQTVKGMIIALEDDQRIRRALMVAPAVTFYRYQVSFKLVKG